MATSGWSYMGGSITPGNGNFCAGFMTDPPNTVVMSDISTFNNTINDPAYLTLHFDRANEFESLEVNHTSGMNTFYNDGRVSFMTFNKGLIDPQSIYFTSWSTNNFFVGQAVGPR